MAILKASSPSWGVSLKSRTGTLRREDALSLSGSHGAEFVGDGDPDARTYGVNHVSLADLLAAPSRQGQSYAELSRVQALSAGVYELPAGTDDLQEPHTEDEVYLVLRGQAQATVGGDTVAVTAGSFLYVPARVPHRFHDIEEHLAVLVVFAPAEGTGVG